MPKVPNPGSCPICGGPLPARWPSYPPAIFCSNRCRGIALRGKPPHNKLSAEEQAERWGRCLTCSRVLPRSGRTFCSRTCYQLSDRPNRSGLAALAGKPKCYTVNPSPRIIRRRAAEVQGTWSPRVERRRRA